MNTFARNYEEPRSASGYVVIGGRKLKDAVRGDEAKRAERQARRVERKLAKLDRTSFDPVFKDPVEHQVRSGHGALTVETRASSSYGRSLKATFSEDLDGNGESTRRIEVEAGWDYDTDSLTDLTVTRTDTSEADGFFSTQNRYAINGRQVDPESTMSGAQARGEMSVVLGEMNRIIREHRIAAELTALYD